MSRNRNKKRAAEQPKAEMGTTPPNPSANTPPPAPSYDPDPPGIATQQLPREIPSSWITEISKAIEAALKKEKPMIIITTILGSSVLGSLLGIAGNYWLVPRQAYYATKSASDVKLAELRLQNSNKDLEERRKAYEDLDKELGKTANILRTYLSTCDQAARNPANRAYTEFARASWDSLTEQLKETTNAKANCKKSNPTDLETFESVSDVLGKLGVNLMSPQVLAQKERNPELTAIQETLQQTIETIRSNIARKKSALTLQPEPQG
jgi:hypothetical protein